MESLFSGSALCAIDADGAVVLPPFVRAAIERRSESRAVVIGGHAADPCLTAYDPGHRRVLHADLERRRLADEAAGRAPGSHHGRLRQAFGAVEDVPYDADGRLALPPFVRRRGGLGRFALFVGAGATFEIWDPETALESGDRELRALAAFRLGRDLPPPAAAHAPPI